MYLIIIYRNMHILKILNFKIFNFVFYIFRFNKINFSFYRPTRN